MLFFFVAFASLGEYRPSVKARSARQVAVRNYAYRSAAFPFPKNQSIFGDPVKTLAEFAFGGIFLPQNIKFCGKGSPPKSNLFASFGLAC